MSEQGVEFKGGGLHNSFGGFDGFGGPGKHLALLSLVLQNAGQRGGFGGFGGCGGFGRGHPLNLKLNPFSDILNLRIKVLWGY